MILENFTLLTPEYILTKTSQEALWTYYFGKFNLNKKYVNPLRDDNKADCTFDYGTGQDLLFADWALGKKHYTIWEFVSTKYDLNFHEALVKIANDFNIPHVRKETSSSLFLNETKFTNENKKFKKINRLQDILIKPLKPTQKHFDYWSTFDYKFTIKDFIKFKIIPIEKYSLVFDNSQVTYTPNDICFCYDLKDGQKQIYSPFASKQNKFRQIINNPLIGLEEIDTTEPILITKSNKDNAINKLTKLKNLGNILAEGYKPNADDIMRIFSKGVPVYVLFDLDEAGENAAYEWKKEYGAIPIFLPVKDSFLNYKKVGLEKHREMIYKLIGL
jgi:hypothetical protein